MYKIPFLQTNIDEFNKFINRKIVFYAYSDPYMLQEVSHNEQRN